MSSTKFYQVDEEFIRQVAAVVVRRLKAMQHQDNATASHKIISEQLVLETQPGTSLIVRTDAIVTPLAKDTARDRNITITKSA